MLPERGVIVVNLTQCLAGVKVNMGGYDRLCVSGSWRGEWYDMTPEAALAKLVLAQPKPWLRESKK